MTNENVINKYVIVVSILSSFAVAFTSNAVSVALPTMAVDLNITNVMQNWLVNIYLLVIAAFSVPFSQISSKYGLKRTMEIGLIIYIIGTVLTGLSNNFAMILFSRIIHAIGSAFLFVNGMAILTVQIPPQRRGQAMGYSLTGVYLGLTLAPSIGGILVQNISWRSIFYITIPLIIVSYYLLTRINKEWINDSNNEMDVKGSILFIIAIVLLMYGFTILNQFNGIISLIFGLLILLIFAKYELNISNPIYDIYLFKNKTYALSNIASLISYFATFVIIYILNYHLQYLNGYDPQTTGLILIVNPILMVLIAPLAGRLSDRIKPQYLATGGMSVVTISVFILSLLNETTPLYVIIVAMFLEGIGLGFFTTPNNNVIMSSVDKKDVATASASVSTVRTIGQSFSLGLLTLVFELIMGNVAIVPENYYLLVESSQVTMIISVFLCVIATLMSLAGIKSTKKSND